MEIIPSIFIGVTGLLLGLLFGFFIFRKKDDGLRDHFSKESESLKSKVEELIKENSGLQKEKELVEANRKQMTAEFKAMSLEALNASRENFLALAQEKFAQMQTSAQTHIKDIVKPVSQTLTTLDEKVAAMEKERQGAYGELREHLNQMRQDQDKLRGETSSLVQALRSPATRGQWGEMQLKRTLEMAGLVEGVTYKTQFTVDDQRPDVVVFLPGGKTIVIDAKTPIDAYLDSMKEGITETDRHSALDRHARHVRDHIKQLGAKSYWEKFDTPEFVIMFLPGESYYSAALERDPSLLEAGVDQRVIPSSPTTLIALLKAVNYGWQQEKLRENALEISEMGTKLYKSLRTFSGHLEKVGRGLTAAVNSYNSAIGSFTGRILPAGRKFHEKQNLSSGDVLPDLSSIDKQITAIPAIEDDADDETPSDKIKKVSS